MNFLILLILHHLHKFYERIYLNSNKLIASPYFVSNIYNIKLIQIILIFCINLILQ